MERRRNIFDSEELRESPFGVPDGYFAQLRPRLDSIPAAKAPSLWTRSRPYMSMAAAFLAVLVAGTALLRGVSAGDSDELYMDYAYIEPSVDSFYVETGSDSDDALSSDELEQYIINSAISVEHLTYIAYHEANH